MVLSFAQELKVIIPSSAQDLQAGLTDSDACQDAGEDAVAPICRAGVAEGALC